MTKAITDPVTDIVLNVTRPLTEPLAESLAKTVPAPLTPQAGGDAAQARTPKLPADLSVDDSGAASAATGRPTAVSPGKSSDRDGLGPAFPPTDSRGFSHRVPGYGGSYDRERLDARYERPVPAPAPSAPCNSAHGAVQQSGETHTPRKKDQHAATLADGSPFALASGAGCVSAQAPTRERPREILEFPG
ncbi:hypothetical protein OG883_02760 [Streptomyces sp. NBC_01142]|uniref:hypothetical protein n=1 Tax=Streptomyces sp. NBC_01142 TaxID=2975865 RepID=UPI00224C9228|nr:hypothetical protein [Streptomyces sp. NBC_01142]MCX4818839.1 hypothetical protein [Streptomyces sp. NBC_01142]